MGAMALTFAGCGIKPCQCWRDCVDSAGAEELAGWPTHLPPQAQIHGFELDHPNVYPIYDLLEHMKGPVLQI